MKRISAVFILLALIVCSVSMAQSRPNIIVFLVDDMGWQDTSVPFWTKTTDWNKRYHTPHMERLAKEGMKFTNAYATPVCSPSRVSLMTGMSAARHKVTNWTLRKNASVDYKDDVLTPPVWNVNGLSPVAGIEKTVHATPLPALLQKAGYYTVHCGKAHFGAESTPAADPVNIGFDVNIAGHAAGGPGSFLGEENYGNDRDKEKRPWGVPGLKKYHGTETFLTEALTIEALKALDERDKQEQPFFLYMSHYAVHVPYGPDKRFIKKYIDAGLPQKEAEYAALVEGMDKSLGDIMDYVKEKGIEKNTIIIFMSDNGGFSQAPRAGKIHTQNMPLRAGKGSIYEGGIREPMLVKWPGKVKPGSVNNNYLIIEDFFPTILQMAQVKNQKTIQKVDGISFLPLLKNAGNAAQTRALIWHFPNKWIPNDDEGINFRSAVRQGDWKLIYNMKTGSKELYNLTTDIGERNDVSKKYPRKVAALSALLTQQLKNYDAQMPVYKNDNKSVAWPAVR